jgi:2-polyprenyl-3-methyl-5-hydroxy-6-metoxy-1,4-benzoquinol methylase
MGCLMTPNNSDLDHLRWLQDAGFDAFSGLKILDLGCGSGYVCHKAMTDGAHTAIGIDVIPPRVSQDSGWQFMQVDLNAPDWHQAMSTQFDLILAFDILEHLDSPYFFLKSCSNLLSSKGQLVLTTPNTSSWERLLNPTGWSGAQDPQHKILFTKYSLQFLLDRLGLKVISISAPVRSLAFLKKLQPHIGGQILCVAKRK